MELKDLTVLDENNHLQFPFWRLQARCTANFNLVSEMVQKLINFLYYE